MNPMFLSDLEYLLNGEVSYIKTGDQDMVRFAVEGYEDKFPMICFEHTDDSDFEVSINESKFLNDNVHNGTWIVGYDDMGDPKFIVNLVSSKNTLMIDTLEVSKDKRRKGIGANVVSLIETACENYYNCIVITPFDTNAINFWTSIEYKEGQYGFWYKGL